MLPGLSGNEPLHTLIARNNVRFPKAFFYRSRLCLSLETLPDPSAYASGSSQKSSEVAILRLAFDQSLSLIIPCGLCVSDQMVRACALRDCLDVSRPFLSDTSPKCIDREGLGRCRTGKIHNKFSFCVTRPVTNGNAVDHIDRIQLPKVSSGSVKNMAFVGLFNPAGSQTLFQ